MKYTARELWERARKSWNEGYAANADDSIAMTALGKILETDGNYDSARREGYEQALRDYAWWKDGVQYVGCGAKTLQQAIDEQT